MFGRATIRLGIGPHSSWYLPDSRIKCWAVVVWFVAVTFICDHPDIQAISFVGSDRAVSFSFLSSVTSVVYTLLHKSLKVLKFIIESSKSLEVLKAMNCPWEYCRALEFQLYQYCSWKDRCYKVAYSRLWAVFYSFDAVIGSRPSDHYFRSVRWFVCLSVCLFVQSFSQPFLIQFRSN